MAQDKSTTPIHANKYVPMFANIFYLVKNKMLPKNAVNIRALAQKLGITEGQPLKFDYTDEQTSTYIAYRDMYNLINKGVIDNSIVNLGKIAERSDDDPRYC